MTRQGFAVWISQWFFYFAPWLYFMIIFYRDITFLYIFSKRQPQKWFQLITPCVMLPWVRKVPCVSGIPHSTWRRISCWPITQRPTHKMLAGQWRVGGWYKTLGRIVDFIYAICKSFIIITIISDSKWSRFKRQGQSFAIPTVTHCFIQLRNRSQSRTLFRFRACILY